MFIQIREVTIAGEGLGYQQRFLMGSWKGKSTTVTQEVRHVSTKKLVHQIVWMCSSGEKFVTYFTILYDSVKKKCIT